MSRTDAIREGMPVYGSDNRLLGVVERVGAERIHVGRDIPRGAIGRVDGDRVFVQESAAAQQEAGEVRIPVAEERLHVEPREAELGRVQVHKSVVEERVEVPVDLQREEVRVERRDVGDRPATDADLFQEGTIRVPVRGEEAVVEKEAVVTGEVVIGKERVREGQEVTDTVRRERVEVTDTGRRGRDEE